MAGIADADRVDAFAAQLAADVRWLRLPHAAGSNRTRIVYQSGAWPARSTVTEYAEWVDPTGSASVPTGAARGDTIIIGSTVTVKT